MRVMDSRKMKLTVSMGSEAVDMTVSRPASMCPHVGAHRDRVEKARSCMKIMHQS